MLNKQGDKKMLPSESHPNVGQRPFTPEEVGNNDERQKN
jgi:hypothetical protein